MKTQSIYTYGLLLDTSWYGYNTIEEMYSEGVCDMLPQFTGRANFVTDPEYSLKFKKEPVYFIRLDNQPSLFLKAYDSPREAVDEINKKLGRFVDPGFNTEASIVLLSGNIPN